MVGQASQAVKTMISAVEETWLETISFRLGAELSTHDQGDGIWETASLTH